MKKMLLAAGLVLASVFGVITTGTAQDAITVVSLGIDDLPRGSFSIYCSGTHIGNGKPSFWSRRNSFVNDRLLIQMSKNSNIVEIQRDDKQWDSFRIPLENFPNDGKRHTFREVRRFDKDHAYTYSVTAIAEKLKKVTFRSFHVPSEYLKKTYGDHKTFTEPVIYMEIFSGNTLLARTKGQPMSENKTDFIFDNVCYYLSDEFPLVVKVYAADKKALEKSVHTASGTDIERTAKVVAVIGNVVGILSPSLELAATGTAIGLTANAVSNGDSIGFATVPDAYEVVSFEFNNADSLETQSKTCKEGTSAAGLKVKLVVK